MKIALIVPGGVDRGGRERVIPALLWLIERLARHHQVLVIATRQYPYLCRYSLLGAEILNLGSNPYRFPRLNRIYHYLKIIREIKVNFNADILHGFWAGGTGFLAVSAAKRLGKPVVVSIAGGELVWIPEINYGHQRSFVNRREVAWTLKNANRVTAGSRYVINLLNDASIPIDWLPLGVDTNLFYAGNDHRIGPPWRLIHVGSINRVKNQPLLLKSFQSVLANGLDAYLDWVGEDTLAGELQRTAARMGLENRVIFHGFLPLEDIVPLYQKAHLFIQTSWFEAQGVAVCEAAALGVPTVGTDVGIVSELSPSSAVAVPVNDAQGLASQIVSLLEDETARLRIARNAQEWALSHNADWTASAFMKMYAELSRDYGGSI